MIDSNIEQQPKISPEDITYVLVKAGISKIPGIGTFIADLLPLIIIPPITKRRNEWNVSIAKGLIALEEKVNGFKIENLSKNDMFITTVMYATQSAIRNHQQEKLDALQNAVLNAALPNAPEDDIQLMFLNFIDTLTPWHLRILKFFDNPLEWNRVKNIKYPNYWTDNVNLPQILECTFPALKDRYAFYDQIIKDLATKGLMGTMGSLNTGITLQGALDNRTTAFGKEFLKFITSPIKKELNEKEK